MHIPEFVFENTILRHSDEIRLVKLLPFESIPEVRLSRAQLSKKPSYEALSYSWGVPEEHSLPPRRSKIRIDGSDATITANLNGFLRHASESNPNRLFWIDALCMNQRDSKELQHTIQLMPKIYKHASRTLCWLPIYLDDPESRLLQRFEIIPSTSIQVDQRSSRGLMSRPFTKLFKAHTQSSHPPQKLEISRVSDPDPYRSDCKVRPKDLELQTQMLMLEDGEAWRGLNTILEDRYFSRLWVLPDWVLADRITIQCYSAELDWDKLCSVLDACLFYCPSALLSSPGVLNLVSADYLKRQKNRASRLHTSFEDVVIARQNGSFAVTNINDYTAAFTGICQEFSLGEVGNSLEASRSLGLFSLSREEQPRFESENRSWATDWSLMRRTFLLNHRRSSYKASSKDGKYYSFEDQAVMICEAIELDFIREVSQYLPTRRHCDHYNVEGYNTTTFGQWFELAEKSRQRVRGTDNLEHQTLRDFADTIQARGCNSIWETPELIEDAVEHMRQLLAFLEDENTTITSRLRVFYAACFPSHGRKFAITGRGNYCLVPRDTTQDDRICVPHGSRVPFVFRKKGSYFINLGEAYVHGYMNGEANVNMIGTKEQTFRLL